MQKELLGAEERMRLLQQEISLIKVQVSAYFMISFAVTDIKNSPDMFARRKSSRSNTKHKRLAATQILGGKQFTGVNSPRSLNLKCTSQLCRSL
jgi:hypothetical protein